MPTQVLGLLTAGVVVAHLLVLLGTTHSLQATKLAGRVDARPFSTRSVALGPTQPPAAVETTVPSTAAARTIAATAPVPAPRPKKAAPGRISSVNPDITTIGPVSNAASDLPASPAGASGEPVASTFENVTAEAPGAAPTGVVPTGAAASAAKAAVTAVPPPNAASAAAASEVAVAQPAQTAPKAPARPASAANTAYTVPGSTRLKYNVIATKGSLSFNARAELLWLQDGSTYDARLEVSAFLLGARIQTSTGRLTAEGLEPKRFADKFRSEVAAHFERDKRLVTFSANTPQVPLLAGMQDQLSVVMQLSAMIAGAPAQYPSGTAITFDTVGPRSSETWVLMVGEEEKLSLPGGELQALKLTRKPRGEYDQTLELWLAPQLAYLPARIKLTEKNGDYADQIWRATEAP
jgi:hypothetical protein